MIETIGLVKRYGDFTAVNNVSFKVSPGEVLGFLGPNGAGKSTTMKMISGFLAPTAGTSRVCGFDVDENPIDAKKRIGYLPEGAPGYGEMTPLAFLRFIAEVRGLNGKKMSRAIDDAVERLHLHSVLNQPIDTLSKGFKRRVGLAQAIIHNPPVLILDEPTDGLDPNQKHDVRKLINDMGKDKTLIISTHILEEVHAVCTRAVIIAGGKLLADETPTELESRSRYYKAVSIRMADGQAAKEVLKTIPDVNKVEVDAAKNRVTAFPKKGKDILLQVREAVRQNKLAFDEMHVESGHLDEVFRAITLPHSREV